MIRLFYGSWDFDFESIYKKRRTEYSALLLYFILWPSLMMEYYPWLVIYWVPVVYLPYS